MLQDLFRSLLLTSCIGAALSIVLLVLRPLTKRHFSSSWHYYLWLVVLVVMMVPWRLPLSVTRAIPIPTHMVEQAVAFDSTAAINGALFPDLSGGIAPAAPVSTATLAYVWLAVAAALFAAKLLRYAAFWRRVRRDTRPCTCPEAAAFTRKPPRVRVGTAISSPQLVGLFRPTLLLPQTLLSAEQLGHVLSHEMTHLKRCDLMYKWFAFLVKCVHWFNPMVYVINRQIRLECEISCDLSVVKTMDAQARERYIHTILWLLSGEGACGSGFATEMVGNLRTLKRRFRIIQKKPTISKTARWMSLGVAVILAAAALLTSGVLGGSVPMNTQAQSAPAPVIELETTDTTTTTAVAPVPTEISFCWPCPNSEQITSGFGYRWGTAHSGIDVYAALGSPIVAAADGTVVETNPSGWGGGYGLYVVLDHGGGLITKYGCLDSLNVSVGQTVSRGQEIGCVGNTGNSTGPHLHFEVQKDGVPQDPANFF